MEAAAIFVVARVLGCRAGALLLVAGNQELDEGEQRPLELPLDPLLDGAIDGLRTLIAHDHAR